MGWESRAPGVIEKQASHLKHLPL